VIAQALGQLPFPTAGRVGHKVLIRTDGAGGTHEVVEYLTKRSLSYSLGFGLTTTMVEQLSLIPAQVWTPAYDAEETPRDGAWVAELTGLLDLSAWPAGMRVIVRKERPHPGAQLRFTDTDGLRLTAFITNTRGGQLADLELRHRRRARCEDRIRICKDTGLQNLPLHGYAQNQLWVAVVCLAVELTAWTGNAGLHRPPRPAVGTQTPAAAPVRHRRPPRPPRPTTPPPAVRSRPLASPHLDCSHTPESTPHTHLTSTNPPQQDCTITGTVEPADHPN